MASIGQPLKQWDVVPEGVPAAQPNEVPPREVKPTETPELVPA